jgi:ubiquitin C-terminal hydrolase
LAIGKAASLHPEISANFDHVVKKLDVSDTRLNIERLVPSIENSVLAPGEKAYLVTNRFVSELRTDPSSVTQLCNSDLVSSEGLRPDLKLGVDYWLVSQEVWSFLRERFEPSPELSCFILSDGTPELTPLEISVKYGHRTDIIRFSRMIRRSGLLALIESHFDLSGPFVILRRNGEAQIEISDPVGGSFDSEREIDIRLKGSTGPDASLVSGNEIPCGLRNGGNCCYLNASLQALFSFDSLRGNLEQIVCEAEKPRLLPSFVELCMQMREMGVLADPARFKTIFSEIVTSFRGSRQQDAHEFITFLLDNLVDECSGRGFLRETHFGELENRTICTLCSHESTAVEAFSSISLPVAESRRLIWSPYNLLEPLSRLRDLPDSPAILIGRNSKGENKVTTVLAPEFVAILVLERPEVESGFSYTCLRMISEKRRDLCLPFLIKVPINVELSDVAFYELVRERLLPLADDSPFRFEKRPLLFTVKTDDPSFSQQFITVIMCDPKYTFVRAIVPPLMSLPELLARYFREITLDAENQWRCPNCRHESCAFHRIRLCTAPRHLILHLKRFSLRKQTLARDNSDVIVPYVIDLASFFKDPPPAPVRYALTAIANHTGTPRRGHYTAFGKRHGLWFFFNDEVVTKRNPPPNGSPAPYILFYTRLDE